jgi:hypothetical protein
LSLNVALTLAMAIACFQIAGAGEPNPNRSRPTEDPYLRHRDAVIRINDLALQIHSVADAGAYVSAIRYLFEKELPPSWAQDYVSDRITRAEFNSVSNPPKLVSEQHIADVWNQYVREIAAPTETLVTAAEIHNMRDAQFTAARVLWSRGQQTIWTMPNAFALGADGKVADGCRAVEAVRVMHDLDQLFQNLIGARERLRKGVIPSDEIEQRSADQNSRRASTTVRLENASIYRSRSSCRTALCAGVRSTCVSAIAGPPLRRTLPTPVRDLWPLRLAHHSADEEGLLAAGCRYQITLIEAIQVPRFGSREK